MDRLHEHDLGAVELALDHDAQIGDEDQALVDAIAGRRLLRRFAFRVRLALGVAAVGIAILAVTGIGLVGRLRLRAFGRIALHRQQEDAALVVAVLLQIFADVHRFVMRTAALQIGQGHFALVALGQIIGADAAVERRLVEIARRLRDQMLQLSGQHACEFDAHTGQVAHQHRHLLLAAHRQQRALAQDAQLRRERRHFDDAFVARAEQIAAISLGAFFDAHEQITADIGAVLVCMPGLVFELGRHGGEVELARALERRVGHFRHFVPGIRRFAVFGLARRVVNRQLPDREGRADVLLGDFGRGLDHQHLFRIVLVVGHHRRFDLVDLQGIQARHGHVLGQRLLKRLAAARRGHAFVDLDMQGRVFGRDGQIGAVQIGVQLEFVVGDGELGLVGTQAQHALGRTGQLHAHARFERGRIDRMAELEVDHDLLLARIDRIDRELRARNLGDEGRRMKGEVARAQADLGRDRIARQAHLIFLADRPIFLGQELQFTVAVPMPDASHRGRHLDALRNILAHQRERRHAAGKLHDQRIGPKCIFDLGAARIDDLELDFDRLGLRLPPFPAVPAARARPHEYRHGEGTDQRPRRQGAQRACDAAPEPTQIPGRLPLPTAEHQRQQRADPGQNACTRTRQRSQESHG